MTGTRSRFARIALAVTTLISFSTMGAARADYPTAGDFSPTPGVPCAPGDLTEETQGRTPLKDYESGRAAEGYTCNASQVSHLGNVSPTAGGAGGYRVHRFTDSQERTCAYFDTTLLFPVNAWSAPPGGTGVWVLDMTDPANPIHTATLSTPAMQSPHESFSLNEARGLLGAVFANPVFYHGQFDLYDIKEDCRYPVLTSTLPMGILGHEGSFAPDGLTYYASSLYGHTLTAIDTSNVLATTILWTSLKWNVHGMNVSDDGRTLYFADLARNGFNQFEQAGTETKGLTILDVSEVQDRVINPQVNIVSHLTWPHVGTPQTALPFTRDGHAYLVEVDEFGGQNNVGAARIIDIGNPAAPQVVSNLRLAVNNLDHQSSPDQQGDPNATFSLGGYRAHYCGLPSRVDPKIVACSFILSGLRVFDITDLEHPKEIAYFNKPHMGNDAQGPQGAYAMSQPAFDVDRHQIWYTDGSTGFYVVQIRDSVWPN